MEFYESFKILRKRSGKTQAEVAKYLNISPQSVSKWERGISLPSIEFLPDLAKLFHCSADSFFDETSLSSEFMSDMQNSRVCSDPMLAPYLQKARERLEEIDYENNELPHIPFVDLYLFLIENSRITRAQVQRRFRLNYYTATKLIDFLIKSGFVIETRHGKIVVQSKVLSLRPFTSDEIIRSKKSKEKSEK